MDNDWNDLRGLDIPSGEDARRRWNLEANRRLHHGPLRWMLPAILACDFLAVLWPGIFKLVTATCLAAGFFFWIKWQVSWESPPRERWMRSVRAAAIVPVLVLLALGVGWLVR
ncbi:MULTISPECIES: hypothetical protein [Metallibacterium]|jgi:hypothetical protein|uniref:hypothetical protein n=1 Tax=Metallibacterium TaxID=1218803 RepID=UPI0026382205|nr:MULTISPECIES: hypothetical protein [Metallibacterium]MBW8075255.1 hypothetical protein [Metallibacterium scheffleri]